MVSLGTLHSEADMSALLDVLLHESVSQKPLIAPLHIIGVYLKNI